MRNLALRLTGDAADFLKRRLDPAVLRQAGRLTDYSDGVFVRGLEVSLLPFDECDREAEDDVRETFFVRATVHGDTEEAARAFAALDVTLKEWALRQEADAGRPVNDDDQTDFLERHEPGCSVTGGRGVYECRLWMLVEPSGRNPWPTVAEDRRAMKAVAK